MKIFTKIILCWLLALLGLLGSLFLPHEAFTAASFLSYSIQSLLFIGAVFLFKHEPARKNRYVFLNFALLFSVSFLFHVYNFLSDQLARLQYFQYISAGLYFFLLTFAIGYLAIDLLFRDFRVLQKYLLTFAVVGGFFAYYYHPYLSDSRYLYKTEEIREWKELDNSFSRFQEQNGKAPNEYELASFMRNADAPLLGRFDDREKFRRVSELFPYLAGSNYIILLLKPVYLNAIYMCVLSIGLILLFFGYQYKKDPPQGAYIEKMMFFFLLFCTLEVFHAWSCIKTIELQSFAQIVSLGQYLSAAVLACIAVVFGLRLRFITSAYGEFYEQEIVESPTSVTRWRDAFDNLVIAHFFNRNEFVGRFFVDPKFRTK